MKKLSFTLILLLTIVTLMAQKTQHESANSVFNNDANVTSLANSKSSKKTICECKECGPMERNGRCHNKGRWVKIEGKRYFRCSKCDQWEDGCDLDCQCRKRDKVHKDY